MIKFPGLIDVHVHLRDPGQTEKEDFFTGTSSALAGGFTTILDMPNNKIPITSIKTLIEKQKIAKEKIVCDVGFYFGSLGENLKDFNKVQDKVFGLKIYLNKTTGNLIIDNKNLNNIFKAWTTNSPILLHAEGKSINQVINIVSETGKRVHFCHIGISSDLKQIIKAKENRLPITCGTTPHYLFLTEKD
ncbi:MAG: amidohydrolase family protein, partial [Patescibacteria group bacterium]